LNFEDVEVSVVECPDLTQEPFNLASKGLCGNSRVLDIGGVPYLVPLAQKNKLYDMKDYPKLTGMSSKDDCLIIGAGAAPWTYLERNAEVCFARYIFFSSSNTQFYKSQISISPI
jgi:hypothetical protein